MNKPDQKAHAECFATADKVWQKVKKEGLPFLVIAATEETEEETTLEVCALLNEDQMENVFTSVGKQLGVPEFILDAVLETRTQIERNKRNKTMAVVNDLIDAIFNGENPKDKLEERIKKAKENDNCDCPACDLRRGLFGSMTGRK